MAWLAVDKTGEENIFQFRPVRIETKFRPLYPYSMTLTLPKDTIKKILGYDLTWEDDPVEYK